MCTTPRPPGHCWTGAAEHGWAPKRVKVDGIDTGERMGAAAARHDLDVEVTTRPADAKGFTPLPIRWRIERTFGTQTDHYRRLPRNLEQSPTAAENAVEVTDFHHVLKAYCRVIPAARRDDRYARGVGGAAAREIKEIPAALPNENGQWTGPLV